MSPYAEIAPSLEAEMYRISKDDTRLTLGIHPVQSKPLLGEPGEGAWGECVLLDPSRLRQGTKRRKQRRITEHYPHASTARG